MKTIRQTLIDEIGYPIKKGKIDNKILKRRLDAEAECDADTINSKAFIGATADCLFALIAEPDFSESDISVSLSDRILILKQANYLYNAIGEEEKTLDQPKVYVGPPPGIYVSY